MVLPLSSSQIIGSLLLQDHCLQDIDADLINSTVNQWITASNAWDIDRIAQYLPRHLIYRLLPPPRECLGDDLLSWGSSSVKSFTTKEAYQVMTGHHHLHSSPIWKKIWKWKGMERIRLFLWALAHNRIPTNLRRHMCFSADLSCQWCHGTTEDSLHVVRDCTTASKVWRDLLLPIHLDTFFELPDWLSFHFDNHLGKYKTMSWHLLWGYATWQLWNWRNKRLFDPAFKMPSDPTPFILKNVFSAPPQEAFLHLNLCNPMALSFSGMDKA